MSVCSESVGPRRVKTPSLASMGSSSAVEFISVIPSSARTLLIAPISESVLRVVSESRSLASFQSALMLLKICLCLTCRPWERAASSTSSGNLPLPAMSPIFCDESDMGEPRLSCLLIDPPLRRFDEAQQRFHIVALRAFRPQLLQRLRRVQLGSQQNLKCMMQPGNPLARKSATLQAHFIQHVRVGVAFGAGHGVRQHISREGRPTPDVGVSANTNILVYRAQRAHHGPLFDRYATCQGGSVDQHDVIADKAIVPDVGVGHD